jgi:hypothetical protein
MKSLIWTILVAAVLLTPMATAFAADTPPKAPPVSTFAPAQDLANQVGYYLKRLDKAVASKEDYKDLGDRVKKDANTMIVICLTLGLHDTDNPFRDSAPAMLAASEKLANVKDFKSAKEAVAGLKKVAVAKAPAKKGEKPAEKNKKPSGLKWKKVASLSELMLAVPGINTSLKRNAKLRRVKRDAPKAAGHSAVLAAIAEASMYHSANTDYPDRAKEWFKYCKEMREGAYAVNQAAHKKDKAAARKALISLAKSCDACHEVFHKEALENEDAR